MRAIARYFSALWSGYSEDKERQYELRLIKNWSNVPIDNINIRNIPVSSIEDDTVHCISIVSGDKPSLVIIPGYGASGGFYYKLMEGLSERYNLYIVDMRGMGCSGRPPFPAKSQAEAEKYILDGLECWREKMGLDKILLCGHSMGGYVATKYAYNYPERVKSLVLLSPAGVWPTPPEFSEKLLKAIDNYGFVQRNVFKASLGDWIPGKSPIEPMRRFGLLTKIFFNSYVKDFPKLQQQEQCDMKDYLFQISMKPAAGEFAMPYLLRPVLFHHNNKGAYGVDPLEKTLNRLRIPTSIFFGTEDWMAAMTPPGSQLRNPLIKERMIKGGSHQIFLDQPKELLENILEDLSMVSKRIITPSLEEDEKQTDNFVSTQVR